MCGIVGIIGTDNVFTKLHRSASKIQHRGTDGVGAVFSNGMRFIEPAPHRVLGEVSQSFNEWPGERPENAFLGLLHIRYGTSGNRKEIANTQPFMVSSPLHGTFCLAHNGDSQDIEVVRNNLQVLCGARFTSDSDSEVLAQLIAYRVSPTLSEAVASALEKVRSAYALVLATPRTLIAARDRYGYRPLSIGRIKDGGYIVASETCAFEIVGAELVHDVRPGEVVVIDRDGPTVTRYEPSPLSPALSHRVQQCIFEHVYFSYPTSRTFGQSVSRFRHRMGEKLAEEYLKAHSPLGKDAAIMPVPDSANHYAQGFSHKLRHPLTFAIDRTHRSPRSFIGSSQLDRDYKVKLKFNPDPEFIADKDCFVIEDSLVRGTTARAVIKLIRGYGAKRITLCVGSPPIMHPCFYGVDMKTKAELLVAHYNADTAAMGAFLGVDELIYPSFEGFREVVEETFGTAHNSCFACFNGEYAL